MISAIKNLPIFQPPEESLEKKMEDNPTYPFTPILLTPYDQYPVFQYKRYLPRFYYSVATALTMVAMSLIWVFCNGNKELLYFPVVLFAISLYVCLDGAAPQMLVVDPGNEQYSLTLGSTHIATHHLHNMYIRVQSRPDSARSWAVLNGVGFEAPIRLSFETVNRKKLRILCKRLASKLQLNYFDPHNHSKHHIVRHKKIEVIGPD